MQCDSSGLCAEIIGNFRPLSSEFSYTGAEVAVKFY